MASVDRFTPPRPERAGLPDTPDVPGRDAIGSVCARQAVRVGGFVVDAGVRTWVGGEVFECILDDGTGQLHLAFLGRRDVAGVRVGALLSADGVVGTHRGRLLLLNPFISFWMLND
jgi:hypothetical protein